MSSKDNDGEEFFSVFTGGRGDEYSNLYPDEIHRRRRLQKERPALRMGMEGGVGVPWEGMRRGGLVERVKGFFGEGKVGMEVEVKGEGESREIEGEVK